MQRYIKRDMRRPEQASSQASIFAGKRCHGQASSKASVFTKKDYYKKGSSQANPFDMRIFLLTVLLAATSAPCVYVHKTWTAGE